jgi:hypothetical protein
MSNKSVETRINLLKEISKSSDPQTLAAALQEAIDLVSYVYDENLSLWNMLDEVKASDVENHKAILKKSIDDKIDEVLKLSIAKMAKA